MESFGDLFALLVMIYLYFLPIIVARRVGDGKADWDVVIINVFLGWTIVGWYVAFAKAFRKMDQLRPVLDDLHVAAALGNVEAMRFLLDRGADPNARGWGERPCTRLQRGATLKPCTCFSTGVATSKRARKTEILPCTAPFF